jgi:hypothetical protein
MKLRLGGRRRRPPGRTVRHQLRRLAVLLAIAVTITCIIGYVALSFTVNGLPSYQPSTGWVAVLQPVNAPNVDTVQLLVQAKPQGSQTRAAYDVVVCGARPYTGDLLIGGSARLTAIQSTATILFGGLPTPSLQEYVQVSAVGVPVSWSVDSTVPPASGPDPLLWQSRDPISPMVRLTDSSSLALLQNLVVIFAVIFGITASLVASLLFGWLRPGAHESDKTAHSRSQQQAEPSATTPSRHPRSTTPASVSGRWVAAAGAILLIGYARSRLVRSRHRPTQA